jgi:hypothetical protein
MPSRTEAPISFAELPEGSADDLYLIETSDGQGAGIGSPAEIRSFVADGIMPDTIRLSRVLY